MTRRIAIPVVIGIVACAILSSLGVWQVQRLHWKQGLLNEIAARMVAEPVALPARPNEARHQFLRVRLQGHALPEELHVLTTRQPHGPGFKVISPFELADGRRILIDRGYVPERFKEPASRPPDEEKSSDGIGEFSGTLFWPSESDRFTPAPNLARNIWFARDLDRMARTLETELVLVSLSAQAAGQADGEWPKSFPIAHNIPNNHLGYAVTWFALAAVWAVMTALWVRGIVRNQKSMRMPVPKT